MAQDKTREEKIHISVTTDESGCPEHIRWRATDDPSAGESRAPSEAGQTEHEVQAFFLHLWDGKAKTASHTDLWTKQMSVVDMNIFLYHTIITLADAYHRATNNDDIAEGVRLFGRDLGRHLGLIEADESDVSRGTE